MSIDGTRITPHNERQISATLMTLRIIAGALIMGVITFSVIAISQGSENPNQGWSILFWVAIGGAVVAIIASQVASAIIPRSATTQGISVERALAIYSQRTIVGLAILEGAALLTVVIFLIEGQWVLLAATAFLILLMLLRIPSRGRLIQWIEERQQLGQLSGNEQ